MLQRIRDGLHRHKWLGYVVLGALALVFAAWGAYGIVNLNIDNANYAAEADGQKISMQEARNAWSHEESRLQQSFGNQDIPPALRERFQDQVLEGLIRDALMTQRTHDLGYRVTDADVQEAIRQEPAFQIEGKYSPEAAKATLAQAGLSVDQFTTELRSSLQRTQLENGIRVSDFLTPREIAQAQALENEQREVRYAVLPVDKFPGAPVDDAAVQAYYKAHQAEFMIPESANLEYAELRLDQLAAQMTVTDADLHDAYEKNKNSYVVPERRHARHILIASTKDDAADRKLADEVYQQAKSGKDFAQLAKQYSKDPGSADKGGDLDWADRSSFVPAFSDALFSMKVGEIHPPVKTQYGYHIIRLDEIQPGKTKTFEEARPELEAEVRRNKATDRFGEIQEQLQSRLEQSSGAGPDFDALAKEFKLQTGDVPKFLRGVGGAPLGAAPQLQDLVFGDSAVPTGHVGGPVLLGDDRLVLIKVLDRKKPEPKPLAEVRETIVAALKKQNGTEAAEKAAEDAKKKLEAGTSFDDVAKQLGVTAEPARFVGRTDPAVPAQIRTLVFDVPKPTPDKPVFRSLKLDTGGAAVVEVTKLRTEATDADKQQEAARTKQEIDRQAMNDAMAYLEDVRRTADVRKNPKAFE
jgi:peptidyl-prolyl cis-trans isomerase D